MAFASSEAEFRGKPEPRRARRINTRPSRGENKSAQIDLLIDRADAVVNLCKMKFSDGPFPIDKSYAAALANKKAVFKRETGTRKGVHVMLVTTEGVFPGKHAGIVQSQVVLDDLFTDE